MATAILVDGINLISGLRSLGPGNFANSLSAALRGLRSLVGTSDVAEFFIEAATVSAHPQPPLDLVKSEGFVVRTVERFIESAMIAEMVELSRDHDHIVLVSGDGEFTPAVHAVVGRGTRVTVVSAERAMSSLLRSVATDVVDIIDIVGSDDTEVVRRHRSTLTRSAAAFIRNISAEQIPPLRAVSAGIMLEEHLRMLCSTRNLAVSPAAGIAQMNDLLLKATTYGKVQHRKIALWGAIRNEAAHAGERRFSEEDLHQMEVGIQQFKRETNV